MQIALITLHTPTPANCRGASALPYHLLAFRPKDVHVEVWSFNLNGCTPEDIRYTESTLALTIHLVDKPQWFGLLAPAAVRLLLPRPMLSYLRLPDAARREISAYLRPSGSALWIYGEDIAHLSRNFPSVPAVVTTPDCEAMYYHRLLSMQGIPLSKLSLARYTLMYHRYATMAARYPSGSSTTYHLVGQQDALFLKRLNPGAKTVFIPHPHYDVTPHAHKEVSSGEPVRLLIAGRYDLTMAQAVDEAIDAMMSLPSQTIKKYKVTFLGKGWDQCCTSLRSAGFDTVVKGFVEDYAAEVTSHHIQLTPITVGTGTKGKVLDAFANGLMVIGTPLALENIAVAYVLECACYTDGLQLAQWLSRLADNPAMINSIARAGNAAVLREHSRQSVARTFFHLFE